MSSVIALSDAAIFYGARRYYDGVHHDPPWPHREEYKEEDDRRLFLEFLHNLCLYDKIVMDWRPIGKTELRVYQELADFLKVVTNVVGESPIEFRQSGVSTPLFA
jgi:hypothetical protein